MVYVPASVFCYCACLPSELWFVSSRRASYPIAHKFVVVVVVVFPSSFFFLSFLSIAHASISFFFSIKLSAISFEIKSYFHLPTQVLFFLCEFLFNLSLFPQT